MINPPERPVPPPSSWAVFEDLCLALFRAIWQDAQAQSSAGQQGVDIVGVNHAEDGGTWGVRCVSIADGQSISIAKINQDVAKADQFRPKLAGVIFATTTQADGRVLQLCKISTNERAIQDLCPVLVYDWDKLQTLLRAHKQVAKKFYPTLFSTPGNWPNGLAVTDFFDPLNKLVLLKQRLEEESCVVVQGVSGLGKTQLALKYCQENKNNYAGIWWFQADTASTLLQESILFCHWQGMTLADNKTAPATMLTYLSEQALQQARWLLVFDNAQDVKAMRNYLPTLGQHDVIITSRFGTWSGIGNLVLGPWPEDKTVETYYLRLSSLRWTKDDVRALVKKVGDTPLSLIQAETFIFQTKQVSWQSTKSKIGNDGLACFASVFAKLNEQAKYLLQLCCWFASQPIPKFLFNENHSQLQATKSSRDDLTTTINQLKSFALCLDRDIQMWDHLGKNSKPVPTLIFLELTREAVRDKSHGATYGPSALKLLEDSFKFDVNNPESSWRCRALLPHAQSLREHYQPSWKAATSFAQLLLQMAAYFKLAQGLYPQALELEQQAYEVLRVESGEGVSDTLLTAMNALAATHTELGDLPAAKTLQEEALLLTQAKKGQTDKQTLTAKTQLVNTMLATDDLDKALVFAEEVYRASKSKFGEQDPEILPSMMSLAMAYSQMGKLGEAQRLQEKALDISVGLFSQAHPQNITLMNNLANTWLQLNEPSKAMDLYQQVLNTNLATHGKEHPNTLHSMLNLAETQAQDGELRSAHTLAEEALQIGTRILGSSHHLVLHIKDNLATYLEQDGSLAAAQALRNDVLASRRAQRSAESAVYVPNIPSFILVHDEELEKKQFRALHRTWLQKLTLAEFRCFENLEIEFSEQLTVFIAPNGAGKTTILDGLALAMGQFVQCFQHGSAPALRSSDARLVPTNLALDLGNMEPRYPVALAAQGEVDGKPFSWRLIRHSANTKPDVGGENSVALLGRAMQQAVGQDQQVFLPLVAYYGTGRLQKKHSAEQKAFNGNAQFEAGFFSRTAGFKDCLDPATDYRDFERWFAYAASVHEEPEEPTSNHQQTTQAKDSFAPLVKAVCDAVNTCLAASEWENLHFSRKSRRIEMQHKRQGHLPIAQLSDGVRNMVALVADIAQRAVRLNPQFGAEAAKKTPGLILIDEVDLHLHPAWQQTVLTNLLAAFPMMQFIVTTHSPQVLTTVASDSIRIITWNCGKANLPKIKSTLGAESWRLLEELQGVKPRPQDQPIVKTLNRYLSLIGQDQWDSEEAYQLRDELDREWPDGDEPSLTKADIDIRLRQFRRGRP